MDNQKGSAIIFAMLILVVVTLIGISATNTSVTELQISANDRLYKQAFYAADGGTEMAQNLIEDNIATLDGFSPTSPSTTEAVFNNLTVTNLAFWTNSNISDPWATLTSDNNRDFYMVSDDGNKTNFKVGSVSKLSSGGALEMAAGDKGAGKSASSSGFYMLYDIYSQHLGHRNSKATVVVQWRYIE